MNLRFVGGTAKSVVIFSAKYCQGVEKYEERYMPKECDTRFLEDKSSSLDELGRAYGQRAETMESHHGTIPLQHGKIGTMVTLFITYLDELHEELGWAAIDI